MPSRSEMVQNESFKSTIESILVHNKDTGMFIGDIIYLPVNVVPKSTPTKSLCCVVAIFELFEKNERA
jgi:hypothetical protein